MNTLVEDKELQRLRAMADGSKPFQSIGLWEKLAGLSTYKYNKFPPRERLGLGYYLAAKRRVESLREVVPT